jgi:hypothetical protein
MAPIMQEILYLCRRADPAIMREAPRRNPIAFAPS